MFIIEFIWAFIAIGIPLGALTYFLVRWTLHADEHKPGSDGVALKHWLKTVKKRKKDERKTVNQVHAKWMKFGGGFYGCMALFTYIYIEIAEIISFVVNFAGLEEWFNSLGLDLIIKFIVNSVLNFVKAIIWFTYWPSHIHMSQPVVWLLAAYIGYLLGAQIAWRQAAGTLVVPAWVPDPVSDKLIDWMPGTSKAAKPAMEQPDQP